MDQLFKRKHTAPTTVLLTSGRYATLTSIATLMSNISSKNAAQSTDNDKEETIDYHDMPKDIRGQCCLKNDASKIITKSNFAVLVTN